MYLPIFFACDDKNELSEFLNLYSFGTLLPQSRGELAISHLATHLLSEIGKSACEATPKLYARIGFEVPWIGYLALQNGEAGGTCGFKSRPKHGRVEIAYFCFPEHEGRGLATHTARYLVAIAQGHPPITVIAAQTLKERNASHKILEKIGFVPMQILEDPEVCPVPEWHLA